MSVGIPVPLLEELSAIISHRMGLYFTPDRWGDLMRGLRSAAPEFGFEDAEACARWLCSAQLGKQQVEILASHLTVGETYFFREKRSFQILEEEILPKLIDSRTGREQRLRVWCAGCCTGEEPYSVAIVLKKLIPRAGNWDVTLLATDINPRFLQKAAAGIYGEWSFRDTPPEIKQRYFGRMSDGRYEVLQAIREKVTFDYLNLAEDNFPSLLNNTNAMDLILCRNVLIYLAPQQIAQLVEKFRRCLCEGGWLLVGAAETSLIRADDLRAVSLPGIIAYQKISTPIQPKSAPPLPPSVRQLTIPAAIDAATLPWKPQAPKQLAEPIQAPPAPTALEDPESLYDRGFYIQAAERLAQRLAADSPSPKDFALMARACANQGNLTAALQWGRRAADADKLNPSFQYLCGTILQEMEDRSEAASAFRRALFLDPNFIMAHFAIAHLARHQGKVKDVSRHFGIALELLRGHPAESTLPDSEGMTVGRLTQIIATLADKDFAT